MAWTTASRLSVYYYEKAKHCVEREKGKELRKGDTGRCRMQGTGDIETDEGMNHLPMKRARVSIR
jgi:hypothetical protein